VDTALVAQEAHAQGMRGDAIGERIQRARIDAVERLQTSSASAA
jgi:hypothetical protein